MKKNSMTGAKKLLREAKKTQVDREREGLYPPNEIDAIKLLQSLQVHQIELEMQNEELKRISSDFEAAKLKYMNLYELAPVGYFTLAPNSTIRQTNLTGAKIFGEGRTKLLGKRFDLFIAIDDRPTFRAMLFRAFENRTKEIADVRLLISSTQKVYLHLETFCPEVEEECLLIATDITDLKLTENILRESELRFANLFEKAPLGYQSLDINGYFIEVNEAWLETLGYKREEVIGKWFGDFLAPDFVEAFREHFPIFKSQGSTQMEFEMIHKSGEHRTITFEGRIGYNLDGSFDKTHCILQDISERRRGEKELRDSESKYRLISENTTDVIWVFNLSKNKFSYVSPSIYNLMGYTQEEALDKNMEDMILEESKSAQNDLIKFRVDQLVEYPQALNYYVTDIQQQPCKNGELIWVEISSKYYFNSDGEVEIVGVTRNIDNRKNAEKDMVYLSYHDHLTGLYNRRYYEEELNRLDTERNLPISLIMADVNGLKLTNDAFGHKAEDLLLKKIAEVLKSKCRADEIVARIGGDEFVILLPHTDINVACKLVERITSAISKEEMDNSVISASFGTATKETMSQDMYEIFRLAEEDMYRHKLSESSSIRSKTINLIMSSLFEKNEREMHHSKRVSKLCEMIAVKLNFNQENVNRLGLAGLMHDIGKIGVSETILNKSDKLTDEEWNEVRRHSEVGYRILSSVNEFSEIANFVLEHHEKWDGTGYPKGLKGEEISIEARIISLADSYDAMTSERTYKNQLNKKEAIAEIKRCSGSQYDPIISKLFVEYLLEES